MLRPGMVALVVLTLLGPTTNQQGCQDVKRSISHLAYYPKRDMRASVVLVPQHGLTRMPDTLSVPTTGREYRSREVLEATFKNPTPPTPESIARGETKFLKTCIPCHGRSMAGDGPVAAKFMPPPDLLKETTRGRSDGYIYSYIRNGGAIMPSYGAQVTSSEAFDLINYIRHMQKTEPR